MTSKASVSALLDRVRAPLGHSRADDGRPAWEQVIELFERAGLPAPPTSLRDEIIIAFAWAWFGEAAVVRIADLEAIIKLPDAKRRQWFISDTVNTTGRLNRADICEAFGVSVPQASADIKQWVADNPGVLTYDKSAKRYALAARLSQMEE